MSNQDKFDGLFMTAVQQSQGIDKFFDNLFSFMRRKTDFFTSDQSSDLVNKAMKEHERLFKEDKQREAAIKKKQEEEKQKKLQKEKEEAAKKLQGQSSATVEEVTEEEAQKIMEEEAKKKA